MFHRRPVCGALACALALWVLTPSAAPAVRASAPPDPPQSTADVRASAATLSHDERERFLAKADVIAAQPIGKGVTKPIRLTLSDGVITHDAAFQSVDRERDRVRFRGGREEQLFRDYYGYNIAAYRLARLLGYPDLVPVSVPRRYKGKDGAFTWWVEKKWDEDERLKAGIEPPDQIAWERQVYLARAFTALVEDTDRNLGNQLVTADFRLVMIDFTRAFRYSRMITRPAPLRKIDRRFLERLETLSDKEIAGAIGRWVEPLAVSALLARRDALVEHFRSLIAERGEEAVLFD